MITCRLKFFVVIFLLIHLSFVECDKNSHKYSKEANIRLEEKYDPEFRNIEKPFRMAKSNLVWSKAVHVSNFLD